MWKSTGWGGRSWHSYAWWGGKRKKQEAGRPKRKKYVFDGQEYELPPFELPGEEPVELPQELVKLLEDANLDLGDLLRVDEISISPFVEKLTNWAEKKYPKASRKSLLMSIVEYIVMIDAMMALELMES